MKVLGYIFGGIFIVACVIFLVVNIVGIVKDVKSKKDKKSNTKGD